MIKVLVKGNVFSVLDLKEGFHQVAMKESDKEKTAFMTPFGLMQCVMMPYGLKNSPPTFQRFMNHVLRDVPRVFVYVDDIIVYTDTYEEHIEILRMVLARLKEHGLILNSDKSHFISSKVEYVGMEFGPGGYRPPQAVIPKMDKYIAPVDKKGSFWA